MTVPDATLDPRHDILDVARGEIIGEIHAECRHHLARPQMHGEKPVRVLDPPLASRE